MNEGLRRFASHDKLVAVAIDFTRVWNYYSRQNVLQAIIEIAHGREVVSVFRDSKFGKRPDMLQYPQDILQAVAEGAVAFHGSVERWQQPMKLDVGMTKLDQDTLRSGWDVFIDPDVPDIDIGKIVVKRILEALKDHGVRSVSVKFSGGRGFHIGIPFESLPEKINLQSTALLYPDILQKIIEYLKWYMRDHLREDLLAFGQPNEISQRINKPLNEIITPDGLDPFSVVSMDIFSSRHLFRLPYSLHEKTLLVSLPLRSEHIDRFEKEHAQPEKIKIEDKFLRPLAARDAEALIIEALDWSSKYKPLQTEAKELPKPNKQRIMREIPEEYFPPCVQNIFRGLLDGKKRSVFVLINFLRNAGWDIEKIEKRLSEWNLKNYPALRSNYMRTQLRWHFRQDRSLLPPNCDNIGFYPAMKVCEPDSFCKSGTENITIKNPVNYPFRKMRPTLKKLKKEFKKKKRYVPRAIM